MSKRPGDTAVRAHTKRVENKKKCQNARGILRCGARTHKKSRKKQKTKSQNARGIPRCAHTTRGKTEKKQVNGGGQRKKNGGKCQQSPSHMENEPCVDTNEPYTYGKKDLHIWQKRPIHMAKETYTYGKKRDLHIWPKKRPTHMAKRDLNIVPVIPENTARPRRCRNYLSYYLFFLIFFNFF